MKAARNVLLAAPMLVLFAATPAMAGETIRTIDAGDRVTVEGADSRSTTAVGTRELSGRQARLLVHRADELREAMRSFHDLLGSSETQRSTVSLNR